MLRVLVFVDEANAAGAARSFGRRLDWLKLRNFLGNAEQERYVVEMVLYVGLPPDMPAHANARDGTMTDGRKVYSADGLHSLAFNARDGLGIALLQAAGLTVAMISNGSSEILKARGNDLGISSIVMNATDKARGVAQLAEELGLTKDQVAFVGDDLWDLPALQESGIGVAVADAAPQVRAAADLVLKSRGGTGAVREFADLLLDAKGLDPIALLEKLS